jgi:hypothetical protein
MKKAKKSIGRMVSERFIALSNIIFSKRNN